MARLIGDAYIMVYPKTDQFVPQLDAQLKKINALKPAVNVRPQLDKASVAQVKADLNAIGKNNVKVYAALAAESEAKLKAQLNALTANLTVGTKIDPVKLAATKASLNAFLDRNVVSVPVGVKADPAALASMKASLNAFLRGIGTASVPVALNTASLAKAQASMNAFLSARPVTVPVQANITQAQTRLQELATRAAVLQTQLMNLRADVNDTGAEAKIAALQVKAEAFARALAAAGNAANFAPFEAQLLKMQAGYQALMAAQQAENAELDKGATFWNRLGLAGAGSLTSLREVVNAATSATSSINLFAGALGMLYTAARGGDAVLPSVANHFLNTATAAHLSIEAVVEFTAIWAPALIAMTTFAAAATPSVIEIGKQLQNMNTAAEGTGRAFDSLATSNASVVASVRPTVYEAFGIALFAVQNHASDLAAVMKTLGQGIDQFAAKAAIAFDSTTGSKFFQQGSQDALALMTSFQQLGDIMGTLFKLVPGYAEILLNFGNTLLGLASSALKVAEPVLQIGIALHGALLYGGLAGTAIAKAFSLILTGAIAATGAVRTFATGVLGLSETGAVVKGISAVGLGLSALASPAVLAGIGLVTGAIVAVAIFLKAASNAAAEFGKTVEASLSKTSVTALPQALANALTQANSKVAASQAVLTQTLRDTSAASAPYVTDVGKVNSVIRNIPPALQQATSAAAQYNETQQQLSQQNKNLNLNLAAIAATFGTTLPGALALASGAQVTSNQLMAQGGSNWAVISTEVAGYIAQLRVMVPSTGALNQALNALNVTQSEQVQNAQKLGSAYQSWIGIVTGGDSAFSSFEQQMATVSDDFSKSGTSADTLTVKVGNLSEKFNASGASMNGTSTAALALRQAFDQQVVSAAQVYSNLQTLSVVSGSTAASQRELAKAGVDLVAQLLPMAAGSKEATAEVFALAQIAGFQGVDSFTALAQWVGNTKNAENDLNNQQIALTLSSANLTEAAKNLSAAMANEVAQGESQAISATTGLNSIQAQLATTIENANGKVSQAATTLAGTYYEALIHAGEGATQAEQDVDAFLTKLGATPDEVAKVNAALASLPKTVTVQVNADVAGAEANVTTFAQLVNAIPKSVVVQVSAQVTGANLNQVAGALTGQLAGGGIVGAAGGMTVRGSGPAGRDSQLIMAAPGELVIPTSHAAAFGDMARRASIPGFGGGGSPEPMLTGFGGAPYSYANPSAASIASPGGGGSGTPGATSYQMDAVIRLLQDLRRLGQQQPYTLARANSAGLQAGISRGYHATSG